MLEEYGKVLNCRPADSKSTGIWTGSFFIPNTRWEKGDNVCCIPEPNVFPGY